VRWDATTLPAAAKAGSSFTAALAFTNTGSLTWPTSGDNPVRVSYHWHSGACETNGPVLSEGLRAALPAPVPPGAGITGMHAEVVAPPSAGTYCLEIDLVQELVTWFSEKGAPVVRGTVEVR
jgi:hypothetical protein